jgi:hypothetical protein
VLCGGCGCMSCACVGGVFMQLNHVLLVCWTLPAQICWLT